MVSQIVEYNKIFIFFIKKTLKKSVIKLLSVFIRIRDIAVSVFAGLVLLKELLGVALWSLIDDEFAREIILSSMARCSLFLGFLFNMFILAYGYKHFWPYWAIIYLSWQLIRVLYFLGKKNITLEQ